MQQSESLGEYLKRARTAKQLSLRAVQSATGISNPYLSQVEGGKIRNPSPVNLHKLSKLYEVPYSDLMQLAGYPLPDSQQEQQGLSSFAARLGPVSEEEADALTDYLDFLRSKRKRRTR